MSNIKLSPNPSGTGSLTIAAPNTNSDVTFNLPTTLGNAGTSAFLTTDASGNAGLGVTPSAWNASYKALQLAGGAYITFSNMYGQIGANSYLNTSGVNTYISNGLATQYEQSGGAHVWRTAPSGTAGNAITFTQAMTLDSSGNLLVGATSSSGKLTIKNPSVSGSQTILAVQNAASTGTIGSLTFNQDTDAFGVINNTSGGALFFSTNATERARIDSSGRFCVNTTTDSNNGLISVKGNLASQNTVVIDDSGTTYGSTSWYISFRNSSGATIGKITHDTVTTVAYVTSSDARLKRDLGTATDTSVVDNIVVHDFEWKDDGRIDRGVFAQEAQRVKPSAVNEGSDELTEDNRLANPWGVDYSKFVPDLIVHAQQLKKQVQEQQAIIEQLKADVAALKAAK